MLKILYNEYKGYVIPKGSNMCFEDHEIEDIVTDGFDKFDWSIKDSNKDTKPKSFYEIYNKSIDEQDDDNNSIYADESCVPMNQEHTLDKQDNEKPHKVLSKKERKEANRKSTRRKKPKNDINEYNGQSDPKKVRILNKLYDEILSRFPKKLKQDDRLCQFFDISIYKEDIDDLKDDEWLSDNNISFIYEYLERYQIFKYDKLVSNSIQLVRPSMVYLLANIPDPSELKGVLPPIENAKFIFLPVNDSDDVSTARAGSHWSLVVLSLLDRTAFVFDTMEHANEVEAKEVIKKVSKYLDIKFQTKIVNKTPQQINGSDCGIMVIQLTGFLLSRLLDLDYIKDHYVNFDVDNLKISAIDGRIFVMGTILNIIKYKQG